MSKRIINLRVMQEQYELGAVEEEASWLSQQESVHSKFSVEE